MKKRLLIATTMLATMLCVTPVFAASKTISTEKLNTMLQEALKSDTDFSKGVTNSKAIKVQDAAVLVQKALAEKDKTTLKKLALTKSYLNARDLKRVKDLSKAPKEKRAALLRIYSKGVWVGKSAGQFTNERYLYPTTKLSEDTAKAMVDRVANPKKRSAMTDYGQVTRKTNLPKNKKEFAYILADVPNYFYDVKLPYQGWLREPDGCYGVSPKNFATDTSFDLNYLDTWMNRVKDNVTLRLNINYKNINNTWAKKLKATYYDWSRIGRPEKDAVRMKELNNYMKHIKEFKLVTECQYVFVDPSAVYSNGTPCVRVAAKFRYKSGNMKLPTEYSDYIYGGGSFGNFFGKYKKGEWITVVADFQLDSFSSDETFKYAAPEAENRLYSVKWLKANGFYVK